MVSKFPKQHQNNFGRIAISSPMKKSLDTMLLVQQRPALMVYGGKIVALVLLVLALEAAFSAGVLIIKLLLFQPQQNATMPLHP